MTKGYAASLGFGLVGLLLLTILFDGRRLAAIGGDPMDALDGLAVYALIVAFVLGYAARLIFWSKVPVAVRAAIRTMLSIVMVAIFAATAVGCAQMLVATKHDVSDPVTLGFAVLSAISAVIWLVRHNRPIGPC